MSFYLPPRKPSRARRIGLLWTDLPAPVRMGAVLALLVTIACLSGCATPPEGIQITIPTARAAQCLAANGCRLLTDAELADMQFQAYMLGQREALGPDAFDSHGCKRGNT